jgi:hypothetical protein
MPTDALVQLQPAVTKTATFNGSAVTLAAGTPRRGLNARVIYSAATAASGTDTITFSVDVSYDAGSTWNTSFSAPAVGPLTATALSGEIFIPFSISPTSVANGTQVRLTATFSSAAHTDTITYGGELSLSRP